MNCFSPLQGDLSSTYPLTHPSIHPTLVAASSARCRGEYKMNELSVLFSLASSISGTKDVDPWIYASLKGTGELP